MFVYSLKASKLKVFGLTMLCAIVLGVALTYILHGNNNSLDLPAVASQGKNIRFDGIKTDEDMQNFITSLGIQVKTPAYNKANVDLPRVFDEVYVKYNDIQKQQGFDLSKYCGKTLTRYTFEMTNYPMPEDAKQGKVYLTLFIYKEKIVGGDISSRDNGGFVSTFVDFNPEKV